MGGTAGTAGAAATAGPARAAQAPAGLPDADPAPNTDRVLTLPNAITVARLCCLPVFLWLLFGQENRAAAAWLLGALGITDFVDGYLARHLHQVSSVGRILDPVADRLLFFVGAGGILADGSIPVWFAVSVLVRETLVTGATLVVAALGARRIDVTWWGKAGTFALMIAVPFFLASESTLSYHGLCRVLAWGFGIPGLVLSWYAASRYVPMAREALTEGRQGRRAGAGLPSTP
jgi:cardiolipin synthase (CMP-forming)